ncbi:MAG: hypothetical protein JXA64_07005 [Candidatus Fermentibacteraceae bacterium]|nr:hypothetical protein [Candidatus Fermentibacteraceae bacterium]MBN2608848.1 hypothetical protein [Candidatus Fermentibacteraceae bacterium]
MRKTIVLLAGALFCLAFTGCGGGSEEAEAPPDTSSSPEATPDTLSSTGDGTLRSAAEDILQVQQPLSGAQSLINEAHSAADQANQHNEELQQMIGDI